MEVVAGAIEGIGDAAEGFGDDIELNLIQNVATRLACPEYTGCPQKSEMSRYDGQVNVEAIGELGDRAGATPFGKQVE